MACDTRKLIDVAQRTNIAGLSLDEIVIGENVIIETENAGKCAYIYICNINFDTK